MKEQDQTNQPQEKKKRAAKPNFGLFLGNNGAAAGKPQGGAAPNPNRQPQERLAETGDKRPVHPRAARPKDNDARRENTGGNGGNRNNGGNANAPVQHRRRNEPASGKPQNAPAAEPQNVQGEKKGARKGGGKSKRFGNPVKIMFLGGVGEIGKNMTAIEYGNDIIVIDAGLTFPDEELPGIDLVIPDISYLVANRKKVRGILITHGHEDHVGGLPYLLKEVSAPVFGTKLTLALADNKLREHRLNKVDMRCVKPKDKIKLGCFGVEFINVNHSIGGRGGAVHRHAAGTHLPQRRLQDRPDARRGRPDRPSPHFRDRKGRRQPFAVRIHERGAAGIHDERNGGRHHARPSVRGTRQPPHHRGDLRLQRAPLAADHRPCGKIPQKSRAVGPQHAQRGGRRGQDRRTEHSRGRAHRRGKDQKLFRQGDRHRFHGQPGRTDERAHAHGVGRFQ